MPPAAAAAGPIAQELRTKRRRYVLAMTQARWRWIGGCVVLLGVARTAGLITIPWVVILAFALSIAGINSSIRRLARDRAVEPWYVTLDLGLGTAMISAVLYALGRRSSCLRRLLDCSNQTAFSLGLQQAWQA